MIARHFYGQVVPLLVLCTGALLWAEASTFRFGAAKLEDERRQALRCCSVSFRVSPVARLLQERGNDRMSQRSQERIMQWPRIGIIQCKKEELYSGKSLLGNGAWTGVQVCTDTLPQNSHEELLGLQLDIAPCN